ncbi:MAG TPA: HEAT repeat domain-containing protein [Verrucomicrobiae bacterium]|nr:HEAT repeat domain-containing protein [Verrucomicrobiae bacterium]
MSAAEPDPHTTPPSRSLRWREPERERSRVAEEVSSWLADAARLLAMARRLGVENAETRALQRRLVADLVLSVQRHGPLHLDVTPRSIVMGDDTVFAADHSNAPTGERGLERELSWILHRDGLRALKLEKGLTEAEAATFLDVLLLAAPGDATDEDLVTMLWESAFAHVGTVTEEANVVRLNPLTGRPGSAGGPAPVGSAPLVDDCPVVQAPAMDAKRLWESLRQNEAEAGMTFREAWARERSEPFAAAAEALVLAALRDDARPEMLEALAASVVTWTATAVQRSEWEEARGAHELLKRLDPSGRLSAESLTAALGSLDAHAITERLDEADVREQARLFAFVVRVGAPALSLLMSVLADSGRSRVRAGATTALTYAFADDPSPLGTWLTDPRWHVVRNIVFVLGQIGGGEVVPYLAVAARHIDARVRRAAIHALGQVPHHLRRSVLLTQLDTGDGRILTASLAMLAREPDARVTEAILTRVRSPEFESRPEEHRVALLSSLADVASDQALPALEELLLRGGWFAKRSAERTAAARAIVRLATPAAREVLEQGLHHRSEAVREACDEALSQWGRT